ncbi:hypothetical protein Tsubulata_034332 [Turnera subulata]|uniref:MADS-box domain-containing protein n=1 Tax=Turnera subulata TaxID=218843 RepID=A0A9Q0G3G5_9ROSI|nr:hypothetical protein Tsubulata_034332 [Turnera subulata]
MGRVKLKIKKLENTNGRQATYAKRKHGIMKKANELSILCDIDIILLMFSPTGKPSICKGTRSIEEVISKFAQLTPQERAKRKLESLEALKKTFKKLDHDVNIPEFLGTSSPTIEVWSQPIDISIICDLLNILFPMTMLLTLLHHRNFIVQDLTNQARVLQHQLSELHKRLSFWTDPDKINSIEHLRQLENSLKESLNRIQAHKESIGRQQLIAIECNNQFQNGMHVPFRMGAEQQVPHMSWVPNNDSQHIVLPEDSNLLSHRDVECCGSSSFGSYSGYFGMGKTSELANSGQDSSLSSLLSELSGTASMRQPLAGNYSCLPYNLNLLNDVKFQSAVEMNLQKSPVEFHANGSYGAPKPDHDSTTGSWASTSGTCGVSIFDEHLYSQVIIHLIGADLGEVMYFSKEKQLCIGLFVDISQTA